MEPKQKSAERAAVLNKQTTLNAQKRNTSLRLNGGIETAHPQVKTGVINQLLEVFD